MLSDDLPAPAPPDIDEDVPDPSLRELFADPPIHTNPETGNNGRVAEGSHAHVLATERLNLHSARFCEVQVPRPAHEVTIAGRVGVVGGEKALVHRCVAARDGLLVLLV